MKVRSLRCFGFLFFALALALQVSLQSFPVSAELQITPSVSIKGKVNQDIPFNLSVTNNFPFIINTFRFSNLTGVVIPNLTLRPNETQLLNLTLKRTAPIIESVQSVVSFTYLVDIPTATKSHQVNITATGFQPSFLALHDGDSVQWNNLDEVTHTVTSGSFDYTLLPNQTATHSFSRVGEVLYNDLILFWSAKIEVLNRSLPQEVNNPINDRTITFSIEITSDPTELDIIADIKNFTMLATATKEGSLKITNKGSNKADRVQLSSSNNWITFDENAFDLNPTDHNFVNFHITPLILEGNETNKTYLVNIIVKGLNTPEYTLPLTVFVEYSPNLYDINTNEGFLSSFTVYCKKNPNVLFCNNTVSSGGGGEKIIIRDSQIPANFTVSQVYDLFKRMQRIEDAILRSGNKQIEVNERFDQREPVTQQYLNESLEELRETNKRNRNNWTAFWIGVFFLFVIAGIIVVSFFLRRYKSANSALAGVMR